MNIKIGIDLRCLMDGRKTGVEEYAQKSADFLIKRNQDKEIKIFLNSYKKNGISLDWAKKYKNVKIKYFHYPNKLLNFSFWLLGWPKIDKLLGEVDIFFMPNIAFGAISNKCKLILTMHDLSFERFPHFFSAKRRLWHFLLNARKWCERANQIWAVSKSTKEDLILLYKIESNKIKVVYPPFNSQKYSSNKITPDDVSRVISRYKLPGEYILFLGTIEPRKNIISIIRAFELLKKNIKNNELKLVIAGTQGWLWEDVTKYSLASQFKNDIIFTGFISEKDKSVVYHLAKVFVYSSFLEGFGYPPLEAMAAGIPVITTSCSSLPETTQDAAVLVDPYRPFEIFQSMKMLLEDQDLCDFYVKKGLEAAKNISSEGKFKA